MQSIDEDIDALYGLPMGDFTTARNALAKRAGDRAGEVQALAKPQAAAWAVNQLYWHRKTVFDALVKAAEARRTAHVKHLQGESSSVAAADLRHRAALNAAHDAAIEMLRNAGDALSPATLDAISRTLDAVPSAEVRGRLVRPVAPAGFSMLAALMDAAPGLPSRPPGDVVVMKRRATSIEAADRAEKERRRERTQLTRELAAAQREEQKAHEALAGARRSAEAADRRLDALEKDLASARTELADRRDEAEQARAALNKASGARVQIERRLRDMGA